MSDNAEILKKLYKIAQNQQKAIRKLAQEIGASPESSGMYASLEDSIKLSLQKAFPQMTVTSISVTSAGATYGGGGAKVAVALTAENVADPKRVKIQIVDAVLQATAQSVVPSAVTINGQLVQ
jgi:lysyl-tRNA synthetase class I